MEIIGYFSDSRQEHWLEEIKRCDWRAAALLASLLEEDKFFETLGKGELYLLTDGDRLAAFATLAQRDCIEDDTLTPWVGFVYTYPQYRGHRFSGRLIEHCADAAREHGCDKLWICTDHVGLYEKYGFVYKENRIDCYGDDSRIYCMEL